MNAVIISCGTELLLGNVKDTNQSFIAEKCAERGIDVHYFFTCGDNKKRLAEIFSKVSGKTDFVFVTGGLGPTEDDVTKETLREFSGIKESFVDEKSFEKLKRIFKSESAVSANKKQSLFPKGAFVLDNDRGTAPGMKLVLNETIFYLMPGVPYEMQRMFDEKVMCELPQESILRSKILKVAMLGERDTGKRANLDGENPTVAPLITKEGAVLRITAKGANEKEVFEKIDAKKRELKEIFGNLIYAEDDQTASGVLVKRLSLRKEKISFAESVTGGALASSIVDVAGASEVLEESFVVYCDEAKHKILNVSYETLEKYGSVSEKCALEMLYGLKRKTSADMCAVTTGFAHTGKVFTGVNYKDVFEVFETNVSGGRNRVRKVAVNRALQKLLLMSGE